MKAILEFDLPEDREEHALAVKAGSLFSAICRAEETIHLYHKHEKPTAKRTREILAEVCRILTDARFSLED